MDRFRPASGACGEPFAKARDLAHRGLMTTDRPIIATQSDLHEAWLRLMRPLGFAGRSLWLMFISADGDPVPQLTEITDLPARPSTRDVESMEHFLSHFGGSDIRLGVLVTRSGAGGPDHDDHAWVSAVHDACRQAHVSCDVVHVATATAVTPVPLDALQASA